MISVLAISLILSLIFFWYLLKKAQSKRLNESGRYEEYVRDRREARRRARSRKREEEKLKIDKNTEGG
jgi:PIN domain nuclease of toxin-antitoxin system